MAPLQPRPDELCPNRATRMKINPYPHRLTCVQGQRREKKVKRRRGQKGIKPNQPQHRERPTPLLCKSQASTCLPRSNVVFGIDTIYRTICWVRYCPRRSGVPTVGIFLWFRGPIQSNTHGFIGVYLFVPESDLTYTQRLLDSLVCANPGGIADEP
ncbi:hypothetical protein BO78DRAFT_176872 [Aspergillus sclerotiicarbonarius CBS 121057]|uniref:Uncharacterized protein n=1 Tax=Aspergillus sclerotiicarbonarius (strain CBS 121057 / IBT 28362) TaxID=1448318 RepID=A0A319FCS2_ASPSB|nr:hypothetical protein BO78DRAFT_176872 [Aspergillus sclerotiicarbonarius CBS 121057]